jgi:hypothetical protein
MPEVDHAQPSGADAKNGLFYTPTSPICLDDVDKENFTLFVLGGYKEIQVVQHILNVFYVWYWSKCMEGEREIHRTKTQRLIRNVEFCFEIYPNYCIL